jgi:peptidyl-prolyl cis-trans isomerase B (cyclophilin B)
VNTYLFLSKTRTLHLCLLIAVFGITGCSVNFNVYNKQRATQSQPDPRGVKPSEMKKQQKDESPAAATSEDGRPSFNPAGAGNVQPPTTGTPPASPAPATTAGEVAPDTQPAPEEQAAASKGGEIGADEEVAVIRTSLGNIVLQLDEELAPRHVNNFKKNIRTQRYNGTYFHRVIPRFLIQGGDANTKNDDRSDDGKGNAGYTVPLEKRGKHLRGTLSMARKPDSLNPTRASDGAQFFILLTDTPKLDGNHSAFGRVVAGMDVCDRIGSMPRDEKDNPLESITMEVSLEKFGSVTP